MSIMLGATLSSPAAQSVGEANPFYSPNEWKELPIFTLKEATTILVKETIWALENRPNDFILSSGDHYLIDCKSTRWWISNEDYGLSPFYGPLNVEGGYDVGWWNRKKLWRAIKKWKRGRIKKDKNHHWLRYITHAAMDVYHANRPDPSDKP